MAKKKRTVESILKAQSDRDIERVLELVVGDYLSVLVDNEEDDKVLDSFARGLVKIAKQNGLNIADYDVDQMVNWNHFEEQGE